MSCNFVSVLFCLSRVSILTGKQMAVLLSNYALSTSQVRKDICLLSKNCSPTGFPWGYPKTNCLTTSTHTTLPTFSLQTKNYNILYRQPFFSAPHSPRQISLKPSDLCHAHPDDICCKKFRISKMSS